MTFSTAFFVILVILEVYNMFIIRKFHWKWYVCAVVILLAFLILADSVLLNAVWEYSIGRNFGVEEVNILDGRTNNTALFIYDKFLKSSFPLLLWLWK